MSTANALDLASLFVAFSDRTRLRLLNLMRGGEVCVCFFVEVLGESQPKISRHLAFLRRAGIVAARRQGKWMHYRIVMPEDAHAARILSEVLEWAADDAEMAADAGRMSAVCCAIDLPVRLKMAPRPDVVTDDQASAS